MYDSVLKIYHQKLKYLNYSKRTIGVYSHYAGKFLEAVGKYPQHLTSSDFQAYLDGFSFTSISQQNQIINAIKFLYEKVLNRKYDKVDFTRPRREKKLPQVIDSTYLVDRISAISNLKHKAILMLAFSVGLRVSEVISLKIKDIFCGKFYSFFLCKIFCSVNDFYIGSAGFFCTIISVVSA